jgi:hypothetical protein
MFLFLPQLWNGIPFGSHFGNGLAPLGTPDLQVHHRNAAGLRWLILIDMACIGSDASAGGSTERREAEAVASNEANYGREAFGAILSAGSGR